LPPDLAQLIPVHLLSNTGIRLVPERELEKSSDRQTGSVYAFSALSDSGDDRLDDTVNRFALILGEQSLNEAQVQFATFGGVLI
jgi:hypothetical protein